MLSQKAYLERTGISNILNKLIVDLVRAKPSNPWKFCANKLQEIDRTSDDGEWYKHVKQMHEREEEANLTKEIIKKKKKSFAVCKQPRRTTISAIHKSKLNPKVKKKRLKLKKSTSTISVVSTNEKGLLSQQEKEVLAGTLKTLQIDWSYKSVIEYICKDSCSADLIKNSLFQKEVLSCLTEITSGKQVSVIELLDLYYVQVQKLQFSCHYTETTEALNFLESKHPSGFNSVSASFSKTDSQPNDFISSIAGMHYLVSCRIFLEMEEPPSQSRVQSDAKQYFSSLGESYRQTLGQKNKAMILSEFPIVRYPLVCFFISIRLLQTKAVGDEWIWYSKTLRKSDSAILIINIALILWTHAWLQIQHNTTTYQRIIDFLDDIVVPVIQLLVDHPDKKFSSKKQSFLTAFKPLAQLDITLNEENRLYTSLIRRMITYYSFTKSDIFDHAVKLFPTACQLWKDGFGSNITAPFSEVFRYLQTNKIIPPEGEIHTQTLLKPFLDYCDNDVVLFSIFITIFGEFSADKPRDAFAELQKLVSMSLILFQGTPSAVQSPTKIIVSISNVFPHTSLQVYGGPRGRCCVVKSDMGWSVKGFPGHTYLSSLFASYVSCHQKGGGDIVFTNRMMAIQSLSRVQNIYLNQHLEDSLSVATKLLCFYRPTSPLWHAEKLSTQFLELGGCTADRLCITMIPLLFEWSPVKPVGMTKKLLVTLQYIWKVTLLPDYGGVRAKVLKKLPSEVARDIDSGDLTFEEVLCKHRTTIPTTTSVTLLPGDELPASDTWKSQDPISAARKKAANKK